MQFIVDFARYLHDGHRKRCKTTKPLGLIPVPHLLQPLPFTYESVSSGECGFINLFFSRGIKFKNYPVPMYTTTCVVISYLEANNSHVGSFIAPEPPPLPSSFSPPCLGQLLAPYVSRIHNRICFKPPTLQKLVKIILELCG